MTASNTLSVTITPSSASNKIFIVASYGGYADDNAKATIFRGATNLGTSSGLTNYVPTLRGPIAMSYLDSPSTTAATTYQVYIKADSTGGVFINQAGPPRGSITCMEIKG